MLGIPTSEVTKLEAAVLVVLSFALPPESIFELVCVDELATTAAVAAVGIVLEGIVILFYSN